MEGHSISLSHLVDVLERFQFSSRISFIDGDQRYTRKGKHKYVSQYVLYVYMSLSFIFREDRATCIKHRMRSNFFQESALAASMKVFSCVSDQ